MRVLSSLVLSTLLLIACGKAAEAPAPGPSDEPKPAAPAGADTAEKAVTMASEGMKSGDFEKLWSVMSESTRKELDGVIKQLGTMSDEALTQFGIKRDEVAKVTPALFFEKAMAMRSEREKARDSVAPTDIEIEAAGEGKAKAKYKKGAAFCETDVVKEADGWKVEMESCEEGG